MNLLEIDDVTVRYGRLTALRGASLAVAEGETIFVTGPNGAGKSTLLKAIAGLVAPQPGTRVTFEGRDLLALAPHEIVEAGVALVPEGRGIFADLTVAENLQLGAYAQRARAREAENLARVRTLFPRLAERGPQLARTMSGGEQQMLAIGRGLMAEPRLIILDEPSLGLSPLLVEELFGLIARLRGEGLSVLLVEQNVVESLAVAHRAYILEQGRFALSGTAAEIAADPRLKRAYLGM